VRASAENALGELGQKRSDWTEEKLLQMLMDPKSRWRETAEHVLAHRKKLPPETREKLRILRHDKRPWVRVAAWEALVHINEQELLQGERESALARIRE
jgi:HEAT repeat protein